MSRTLEKLRRDHVNFSRFLDAVASEAAAAVSGKHPNIALLRAIVGYFEDYPAKHHHPSEELIYGHLICRMPEGAGDVFKLLEEHRGLSERTAALRKAVDGLEENTASPDAFAREADQFVAEQRRHLISEESKFFRDAERFLTADQWAEIDRGLSPHEDPAFEDIFR